MSIVKFRAIGVNSGEFAYGDLIETQMFGSSHTNSSSHMISESKLDVEDIRTSLGGDRYSFRVTLIKVFDSTIGRKVDTGEVLFEGDIVECGYYFYEGERYGGTRWCDAGLVEVSDNKGATVGGVVISNCFKLRVVGNIHQNPELLK